MHPDHLDEDGFIDEEATWNGRDVDLVLSGVVEAVIERKLTHAPELQLSDYDDLPQAVVDPTPKLVRRFMELNYPGKFIIETNIHIRFWQIGDHPLPAILRSLAST